MNGSMVNPGRTIRIFLLDGAADGVLTAEVMNWVGKAIGAPLSRLPDVLNRPELNRPGVYILIGEDVDDPGREKVYFGEADSLKERLKQHAGDEAKEFATRFVAFSSKDENLTKGHVRYIESRLVSLAKAARRVNLVNSNSPPEGNLPEADLADMDFFIGQVQLVLPILGVSALQPVPKAPSAGHRATSKAESATPSDQVVFEFKSGAAIAQMVEVGAEFVVLKGSTAKLGSPDAAWNYKPLREKLMSQGKLQVELDGKALRFLEDIPFSSPSAAAAIICASNINGRMAWRVKGTATPYKNWLVGKLASATDEGTSPV